MISPRSSARARSRARAVLVVVGVVHLEAAQPDAGQLLDHLGGDRRAAVVGERVREHGHAAGAGDHLDRRLDRRPRAGHVVPPAVVEVARERLVHSGHDAGADERHRDVRAARRSRPPAGRPAASSASTGRPSAAIRPAIVARRGAPLGPGPRVLGDDRLGLRVEQVGQQVHGAVPAAAVRAQAGQLGAADQPQPGRQRGDRLGPAGGGVVVGDRDGVEPGGRRVGDELGRGVGAVRRGRVGVQIDPHGPH